MSVLSLDSNQVPSRAELESYTPAHRVAMLRSMIPRIVEPYFPHTPHPPQQLFLLDNRREAFFGGSAGGGKLLSLSTSLLTTGGWRQVGTVAVGDYVYGHDGRPTRVLAVSDIETEPCYALTFSTGETIIAGERHRWVVQTERDRAHLGMRDPDWKAARRAARPSRSKGVESKKPGTGASAIVTNARRAEEARAAAEPIDPWEFTRTLETRDLLTLGERKALTVVRPPALDNGTPKWPLATSPWALGAWLGDGTTMTDLMTHGVEDAEDLIVEMKRCGYPLLWRNGKVFRFDGLGAALNADFGRRTPGSKHIPDAVFTASYADRLAVAQGLIDTDGHVNDKGQIEFCLTNEQLFDDSRRLFATLGIRVSRGVGVAAYILNGVRHVTGVRYRTKFTTEVPLARYERKVARIVAAPLNSTNVGRRATIKIVKIEPVAAVLLRCIQVEDRHGVFLVGDTLVPTHNSDSLLMACLQYVDVPRYSALIIRRSYSDLAQPGAIMERAEQWLTNTPAVKKDGGKHWLFPTGEDPKDLDNAARLSFGYIRYPRDVTQFKGAEYQTICFDELTDFTAGTYTFMFSRLRKTGINCAHCKVMLEKVGAGQRSMYRSNGAVCWGKEIARHEGPTAGWVHSAGQANSKDRCNWPEPNKRALAEYRPSRIDGTTTLFDIPLRMRSACVDEGEVLTMEGWKPIRDVAVGEFVYSMDRDGVLVLKPVLETYRYDHDGPLARVRKKNLYMSMTPDHRVVYWPIRRAPSYERTRLHLRGADRHCQVDGCARPYKARGLCDNHYQVARRSGAWPPTPEPEVVRLAPWNERPPIVTHVMRAGLSLDVPGKIDAPLGLDVDTYLEFLGLFLAEGCTNTAARRTSHYKVVVTQCTPHKQPPVAALLDRMPYRWCLSRNGDFQITNKAAWEHFSQFGKAYDKFVPREVLASADVRQLRLLLKWLVFGDGSVRGGGSSIMYHTVSPRLADDVCEIGVKLGYRVKVVLQPLPSPQHHDRYCVYLSLGPQPTTSVESSGRVEDSVTEHYQGPVYCLRVADNETFVLRQRGTVWISGNSNPGGLGHAFVRDRFVDPERRIKTASYYPARIADNPSLNQEEYIESLSHLEPVERARLLEGNWDISDEGTMFKRSWFKTISEAEMPRDGTRYLRYWDFAATKVASTKDRSDPDWTVGALLALNAGIWYVVDIKRVRETPLTVERLVANTAAQDKQTYGLVRQRVEQEPGSPIDENEPVLMADGSYQSLALVEVGDSVIGKSGTPSKVVAVHEQGELDVVKITTRSGRQVRAALSHPFLTPEGWVEAGALRPGMHLALRARACTASASEMRTFEEFRLAGYFIGDGCCTFVAHAGNPESSINAMVTSKDELQGQDIEYIASSLGFKIHRNPSWMWQYKLGTGVRDWLRDVGLAGKRTENKVVPDWVFTADDEHAAHFLGAYFACDGSVSHSTPRGASGTVTTTIEFYSTSKELLEGCRSLLLRFGIYSTLKPRTYRASVQATRQTMYRLTLKRGDDSQARFAQQIPVFGKKRAMLEGFDRRTFNEDYLGDLVESVKADGQATCRCLTVDDSSFLVRDLVVHNSGVMMVDHYRREVLVGYDFDKYKPTTSKEERARPWSSAAEAGNMLLIAGDWNRDFLDEIELAWYGPHDDQLDAVSGAVEMLAGKRPGRLIV